MGVFSYQYEHGQYRDRTYRIGVRASPSLNAVDSFAVVLFYEDHEGESVEVAKVDNTSHRDGTVHVDRYYREVSAPRKDFDTGISSLTEAERYVRENWRWFADHYERTHG